MSDVRYILVPRDDSDNLQSGQSPSWATDEGGNDVFRKTSDGTVLSSPAISEFGSTGVYYFDVDYSVLDAAHITGEIDWGAIYGANRYQVWRGAATDYSQWLEAWQITLQLYETGTTIAITENTRVTVQNSSGGAESPSREPDASGQIVFGLQNGTYSLVPRATPRIEWQDAPWSVTVDGANATVTQYGTPWTPTAPPLGDYCAVFCFAEEPNGDIPSSGTFHIEKIHSPNTRGSGSTTATVVLGDDSDTIDSSGRASVNILQGAVVDLALYTHDRRTPIIKRKVTVPSTSTANWETL